ncbi:D-beta-hydroxybutyrate dehydrogenase, mitochondrial-like [Amphiura filiformis]|uniref:D-beta-hydroxybutyrate dehydrogenase, mitochondrial-like n=1 Tax=Amphiura filiformis TaxID=82378 RepID=UPI003B21A6EB
MADPNLISALVLFLLGSIILLDLNFLHYFVTNIIGSTLILCAIYIGSKLVPRSRLNPKEKAVFISGCDTGFGHLLAVSLDKLGYWVFAGCLFPERDGAQQLCKETSDRVTILRCDITSDECVEDVRNRVAEICQQQSLGLWAIVNNAGIWRRAEIEWTSMKQLKALMEVNLYGAIRITKAFLPMLRQSKGRVISVSSISGIWTCPSGGPYSMTKYGIEALSDALRYEMYRFGVKVIMIEPGNFTGSTNVGDSVTIESEIWDNMDDVSRQDYGRNYIHKFVEKMTTYVKNSPNKDRTPVVNAMVDAVTSSSPKHRYLVGGMITWTTYYLTYSYRLLPSWLTDYRAIKDFDSLPLPDILSKIKQN